MEPNSPALVVLLFLSSAALLCGVARRRRLWVKILSGLLAMALCTVGGIAVVNDFYGYYTSWEQLSADLSGSYSAFTASTTGPRRDAPARDGQVLRVTFAGRLSHLDRAGLVYLPPQYDERAYLHLRFPVVELLHGTPGTPSNWVVNLGIADTMNRLIAAHEIGPMVLVMPTMSVGHDFQECVNAPGADGAQDDTYITDDVRADVLAHFRVSADPAAWGVGGYSSGGYCAANLALRHPGDFGASAIMDGYFRPTDGPAAAALHDDASAEHLNDPLLEAGALHTGSHPLPAFWLAAGTGDRADWAGVQAFAAALHGVEQVTLYEERGASHNFDAWRPDIPLALTWLWTELATPDQRAEFPISGPVQDGSITAPEHLSG